MIGISHGHALAGGAALTILLSAPAALAGDTAGTERIRIYAGPEISPAYPGAEDRSLSPFFDFSRASGDTDFAYEAPDESFGFPLVSSGGFYVGPVASFTGKRSVEDTAPGIARVAATVEAGVSFQANFSDHVYGFAEIRRGLGGHDGWVADGGLDYILRDGDAWLVSLGPRVGWGNARHQRAYFGVSEDEATAAGIEPFSPGAGVRSVGGTLGLLYQLTPVWGLSAYGRYDRLTGDAADSPITRDFGRKNQYSAGIAVSYTFTRRRDGANPGK